MIQICWDGTKERVIGTVADLNDSWLISGVVASLYTPSQETFKSLQSLPSHLICPRCYQSCTSSSHTLLQFPSLNKFLNVSLQVLENKVKVLKVCHWIHLFTFIIFHIRDIRRIRHLLPLSAVTALANSLVSSKLDYCNSLYSGISQSNLNKLQRIQNSLACVITNTSKYQHITPTLKKLHWLPIKQRIDYKLCLLTYKTLTNQQPTYLYNSLSFPSHSVFYTIFWFTRSFHSICQIITWQKGFLCHWSTTLEFTTSWYPKFELFTNFPFQAQKHTSSKLLSLPRLFPISLDCLPGFWFLLFSFYALSNDT